MTQPTLGFDTAHCAEAPFEVFWKAYPCKRGKPAAMRSWKKIKASELPSILSDIEFRKGTKSWRDGFTPHPSTYLNQRRWEDDDSFSSVGSVQPKSVHDLTDRQLLGIDPIP